jgi:PAS domain S-box-containing protein
MNQTKPDIRPQNGFRSNTWLFTYRVDLDGKPTIAYVSPTIEQTLGMAAEQVTGPADEAAFVHPEDRDRFEQFLAAPPAQGTKEFFRLQDDSGTAIRGRHTFQPIYGDDGDLEALETVVYEKPADWELPFDSIVEAINEGILIVRFGGEIMYVNERMAEMLGYTPEEMVGHMLFDFMSEEWAEFARDNLERRKEGAEEVFDHKFQHKNGEPVWTMVSTKPMSEHRGFRGSLVAIRDISRRKRMENELQEARDELEDRVQERTTQLREANEALQEEVQERREAEEKALEASRAKSAFLANMSHELRTPLNAVIGYTELIQDDVSFALDNDGNVDLGRIDEDLDKIYHAADHLLDLINDILDLSKVEAGKMDVQSDTFRLSDLLDEVVKTTEPVIESNNNELHVEHEGPEEVQTDRTKLKQILINLVGNAGKFTDDGEVTIEVRSTSYKGREGLEIDVADTGIGMDEAQLEELFEPFTQADQSSTREHGGTGLGLTICRRFSEMLGGHLTADSDPGVGSTFTLTLPLEDASDADLGMSGETRLTTDDLPAEDETDGPEAGRGTSVLVIDDDPSVHEMMERILTARGFEPLFAESGEEGVEMAREKQPDVITLDVMMPGQDGWAVLAQLNSDPATSSIPVVMVTMVDDKSAGYALGASDYLVKPIDKERLVESLSKYRSGAGMALVVEDDDATRDVITRHLTNSGWEVHEAPNGDRAFEKLEAVSPDVVLLDLMMPHTDGFEVAEQMRSDDDWREIPIVVITAMELDEYQAAQLEESVEAIYEKGAHSADQIIEEVVEVVDAPAST